MKYILVTLLASVFSYSAGAGTTRKPFTGKCSKAAVDMVVANWANVPNPDPNLEINVVSSTVNLKDHSLYTVKWGDFDGNQGLIYLSTVKVTADCKQDGKIKSKVIGGYDGE
jgi:hypothetical protein